MDYKYIEQLVERYWACETTLEEEQILRVFFSQQDVPAELAEYRDLFAYEATEPATDTLGDDFDERILDRTERQETRHTVVLRPVRARLMPLFRAAAVVAMFVTISNAIQMSFDGGQGATAPSIGYTVGAQRGASVARADSVTTDSMQQSSVLPEEIATDYK